MEQNFTDLLGSFMGRNVVNLLRKDFILNKLS
nr:MAG TPA: hypothetical protein [Caudoviricetes sp.]